MAERIEIFDVTIPAGTPIATPVTIALPMPAGVVTRIEQRWPPGPAGLVGLRVAHSSQVIIPRTGATFLVTDDEVVDWSVEGYPTGDKWTVVGYNTGLNAHTIQFRIHLNELAIKATGQVAPVPIL